MAAAVIVEIIHHSGSHGRMHKVGRANLNRCCARHYELQRIGARSYAAEPNNRNFDRLGHLPNHAYGNRFDGRT